MLIDTHVHLWDLDDVPAGSGERVPYPWLTARLAPLFRTFRLADVAAEMDDSDVAAIVLVQASDSLAETRALLSAAARATPGRVVRVVGWLPLADPAATERALEVWAEDAALVGARHLIHDEADRQWLLRPDVAAGMRALERAGMTFDAVAERPDLLAQVPVVARRHPGLTVVLDHLGKPPIAAADPAARAAWAASIRALAAEPNVVAKISGLNTASRPDWTAADWQPYVDVALAAFGPDRLMIGSDWPVALLAGTYGSVLSALLQVLDRLAPGEREQVLAGTARRVYRIPG